MGRFSAFFAAALMLAAGSQVRAAETATATVNLLSSSGGVNNYGITLKDTGTTNIGTLWFAWTEIPFDDFLNAQPTNITAPAGWIAPVVGPIGAPDGYSIEYYNLSGSPLTPGQSSSAFTFSSTDTPAQLAGDSITHPGIPVTTSIVYVGFPETDAGGLFVANVASVPEPAPAMLAVFALAAGGLWFRRPRRRMANYGTL